MSNYTEQNFFDSSNVLNLKDSDIRFAFGIEGYLDKELKDSPKYVKTFVRLVTRKDGVDSETILPYHKCTSDDFDQFAPPSADSTALIQSIKTNEKRGLFCLDFDKIGGLLQIQSIEDDDNYQRIELLLVPCNYVHAELGDIGDSVSP